MARGRRAMEGEAGRRGTGADGLDPTQLGWREAPGRAVGDGSGSARARWWRAAPWAATADLGPRGGVMVAARR